MSLGIFGGVAGLGAAPSKYWADPRVKQLQTLLNPELTKFKCSTQLKEDGLIGPATCGAWQFVEAADRSDQDAGRRPRSRVQRGDALVGSGLSDTEGPGALSRGRPDSGHAESAE